jgi:hypothetical protein
MALGSTQYLTEMSIRNLPGGKGRPARKADNLNASCEAIVQKIWEPRRLTILWASTACYRDSFIFSLAKILAYFSTLKMEAIPEDCILEDPQIQNTDSDLGCGGRDMT